MRKLYAALIFLLAFSSAAWAQKLTAPVDAPVNAEGNIYYEGVVKVDSTLSKTDLYRRGREWFVNTYVDAKEVLQMDDKGEGKLMGKGVHKYSFLNGINVSDIRLRFTLNLDVKDGRYRYRIYNFVGQNSNQSLLSSTGPVVSDLNYDLIYKDYKAGKRTGYNGKVVAGLDKEVEDIITSLEKAMRTPVAKDDF